MSQLPRRPYGSPPNFPSLADLGQAYMPARLGRRGSLCPLALRQRIILAKLGRYLPHCLLDGLAVAFLDRSCQAINALASEPVLRSRDISERYHTESCHVAR